MSHLSEDWRNLSFGQRFSMSFALFTESIRYQIVLVVILAIVFGLSIGQGALLDAAFDSDEPIFVLFFGAVSLLFCILLISISNCILVFEKYSCNVLPTSREVLRRIWIALSSVFWPNLLPAVVVWLLYTILIDELPKNPPQMTAVVENLLSSLLLFFYVYFWFITHAVIFEGKRGFTAIMYSIRVASWSVVWINIQNWLFGFLAGIGLFVCMSVAYLINEIDSISLVIILLCSVILPFVFGGYMILCNLFGVFIFLRLRDEKFPPQATVAVNDDQSAHASSPQIAETNSSVSAD